MMPWYRWGALALLLALFGCGPVVVNDNDKGPRRVTVYSGGVVVREWRGVRTVLIQPLQFEDPQTGDYVTVTGTVVVEADNGH